MQTVHPSHGMNHPRCPHRMMAHVDLRPSAAAPLLALSQPLLSVRTPKSKGISQNEGISGRSLAAPAVLHPRYHLGVLHPHFLAPGAG